MLPLLLLLYLCGGPLFFWGHPIPTLMVQRALLRLWIWLLMSCLLASSIMGCGQPVERGIVKQGAGLPVRAQQKARSPSSHPVGEGVVPDSLELAALRALYTSTNGPGWHRNTNWLKGTTLAEAATWHGVTVEDGDVQELVLYSNQLRGPLPAARRTGPAHPTTGA